MSPGPWGTELKLPACAALRLEYGRPACTVEIVDTMDQAGV
jgi:hypothetical protein